MFDAGFSELLLIFVIALLILGPERMPRVAAQLGRWIAKARRTANQLRWQLEREVALDEIYRGQQPKRRPSSTSAERPPAPGTPEPGTDTPASADSAPLESTTPEAAEARPDGDADPAAEAAREVPPADRTTGTG